MSKKLPNRDSDLVIPVMPGVQADLENRQIVISVDDLEEFWGRALPSIEVQEALETLNSEDELSDFIYWTTAFDYMRDDYFKFKDALPTIEQNEDDVIISCFIPRYDLD